jgi:hypothetical protein
LLAKIEHPELDIRKPYTDIQGETGKDQFSGRFYDERHVQKLTVKPYLLPINATTAYLTPGFRTKNVVLTLDVALEGRPAELYKALLQLFDDVQKGRAAAQTVMDETMRLLILERDKRKRSIKNLLRDVRRTVDALPMSAEDIVKLIEQHMACRHSSRLPVLIVAAAYQVAADRLGERVLRLHSHTAADSQTGAAGDIQVALIGDDLVVTAYEMKMKAVTVSDIDIALQKIKTHAATIQN